MCSGDKFPCVGIAMGEAVTKLMEERKNLGPMNAGQLFSRAGLAAAEAVTARTEQLPVADIARVTSSSASAASSSVESCNESRVCNLRKATWMHSPTQYEPGASREAPTSTLTRALKEHHTRAASDTARGGMRAAHPSPQPPGPEHCAAARVPERATARHTAQERASGQLPTSRLNAEQQMHRWQLKSSGPSARLGRYIYPGHIVDGRHGGGVETSTRRLVEPAGSDRNGWRCTQNGRTERSQPYLGDGAGPSPPKSARATQTVWYTLDKIPIPPECLRLPIWANVALHITAEARMLACVRMDSFSWPRWSPLSRSLAVSRPVAQLAETRQWFSFCQATRSARDWALTFLLPQSASSAATAGTGRWSLCFGLAPSSPHWRSCHHGTPTLAGEHSVWHRAFRRHEPARHPGWRDARSQALSPLSEPAAKERLIRRDMESARRLSCRPLSI